MKIVGIFYAILKLKVEPRNGSWITIVRPSSWCTWQNTKVSHHHEGDHDFLYFTMHTNILHVFIAPNCRFYVENEVAR